MRQIRMCGGSRPGAAAAGILVLLGLLPAAAAAVSSAAQELERVRHSTPNLAHGADLFGLCAGCHGQQGAGTLDGWVPRIAGQHASVLAKELVDYRYDRRWDPRMQAVADRHNLADAQAIADVTAYVSGLEGTVPIGKGPGKLLEQGAALYARQCRSCHGDAALGNAAQGIPRIAAQHYEYLRRQIHDALEGRRPNFSAAHVRLFVPFDQQDIQALADYLSRLDAAGEVQAALPRLAPQPVLPARRAEGAAPGA
jgi:cytochrome c553